MRRRFTIIALLFAFGASLNIAFAIWLSGAYGNAPYPWASSSMKTQSDYWVEMPAVASRHRELLDHPDTLTDTANTVDILTSAFMTERYYLAGARKHNSAYFNPPYRRTRLHTREYGFPFRSMYSWTLIESEGGNTTSSPGSSWRRLGTSIVEHRSPRDQWLVSTLALKSPDVPSHIKPLPFLANSAIYAVAMMVPISLWNLIARTRTRKRRAKDGRCLACGYELAGLAACPECGTRVEAHGNPERQ